MDNVKKLSIKIFSKYGEDKWWLSYDSRAKAYKQLFEPILVVGFDELSEGMSELLGRHVSTHEFGIELEELRAKAQDAS